MIFRNPIRFTVLPLIALGLALLPSPQTAMAQVRDERPRELSGFSASEAFSIKDDLAVDPTGPTILKLLYRARKTSPNSRNQFSRFSESITWAQLEKDPSDYRFWMFRRKFRLTRVQQVDVPSAGADESAITQMYLCDGVISTGDSAETDSPEIRCQIIARQIPEQLKTGETLNEPCEFEGFLFGRGIEDSGSGSEQADLPRWVFVADRIAWYPDRNDVASPAFATLGKLGFDVGLLEDIRSNSFKGLARSDNEAFFNLLRTLDGAVKNQSLAKQPVDRVGIADLLREPKTQLGSIVQFSAVCRSCTVMPVPYEDIQKRLGVEQYYQLVVFPELSSRVELKEKGQKVSLERFPVTVCCTDLPEGITPETIERKLISVDGVFYRMWKFRTEVTDQAGISGTTSPLIMAHSPKILNTTTAELNRYVLYFVLLVIAAIGISLIYLRLSDKQEQARPTALESLPDKIDVSGLED